MSKPARFDLVLAGVAALVAIVATGLPDVAVAAESKPASSSEFWPGDEWPTCAPNDVGMDPQRLERAVEHLTRSETATQTEGFLISRFGCIVAEGYLGDFLPETQHSSASMAKSFTSALLGIAIAQGLIEGVDARVCQFFEEWDCDDSEDKRSRITLRHLLTLTSGLEWNEDWFAQDQSSNDALRIGSAADLATYVLAKAGAEEPGERFLYSTGDSVLFSRILETVTGKTVYEYALEELFEPIGAEGIRWNSDRAGHTVTSSGLRATVREYSRFGLLFLNKGRWQDEQVVPESWVEVSTAADTSVKGWRGYGYLWHVNLPQRLRAPDSSLPGDAFFAEGINGQYIFIFPSQDLVVTRVAGYGTAFLDPYPWLIELLTLVLQAIDT